MKKILGVITILLISVLISACGNDAKSKAQGKWEHKEKITEHTYQSTNLQIKDDEIYVDSKGMQFIEPSKMKNIKQDSFEFDLIDGKDQRHALIAEVHKDKIVIAEPGKKNSKKEVFKKVED
ncbi:hypothetical protein MTR04_10235 [Staphylococcus agnetis]|uniref:hypothetical protein n=1 Tax=Staphylococcus agnetis TaxID=985762 RepID=UPI00208E1D1F|nr:hypothetical protein [Staphylococcus agnetis]MCO4360694.1 hypothetical protein [Staphylococcus agnetis]